MKQALILEQVNKDTISHVWAQAKPLLGKALVYSNGELGSEDIRRGVLAGTVSLFVVHDKKTVHLAVATEFVTYPRLTTLRVIVLAGRTAGVLMRCMKEFWPKILDWAKALGAEKVEASCHPTMARLLRRYNFYPKYTTVFLDMVQL